MEQLLTPLFDPTNAFKMWEYVSLSVFLRESIFWNVLSLNMYTQ